MLFNIGNDKKIHDIPIIRIKSCRMQSRKIFSPSEMKDLAQSIRVNGILQPITVRKLNTGEYELVAGERRLRAAAMCGSRKVPCIVVNCSDKQADQYSLAENVQRSDMNCFELAEGIEKLMKTYNLSRFDVSRRLGIRQADVTNIIKMLEFTDEEKDIMIKYKLTERHAKALLRIDDVIKRKMVLSEIISKGLNVTQTGNYIDSVLGETKDDTAKNQKTTLIIKDIKILENTIKKAADTIRAIGIEAYSCSKETDNFIEYTIRIPKSRNVSEEKTA